MANKRNSGYAVGIDLGTTYSSVAVWREKYQSVEIITNERGHRTTPSSVAFNDGRCFIGDAALYQATRNPANTIYDVKRLIGRKYNDPAIQDDMKKWPFKVIADEKDNPMIVVKDEKGETKIYSPEQISAKILKKMCEYAETYIKSPIKDVVITVPAYFNDSQRQATKDAGAIAGLNVVHIINEASAAALAYGVDKRANYVDQDRNIFIFDLGGGSFDVSLVNVKDGVYQVKAKAGNNHLGGEDFVNKMMTHLMQEFKRKNGGVDMSGDAKALWKLRTACEKAKKVLSVNDEATIDIDPLFQGIEFCSEITRDQFEELNKEFFQECMEIVERCFKDAEMDKTSVHDVVLVGGSSRIPKLQKLLRDFFNGKKLYESINLDEAVAYGAAVQAAILSESCTKTPISVLLDVTPLSLGIGVHRDIVDVLIPRNTLFPVKKTRHYYCAIQDNHTPVVLKIYECEDDNFLGYFELRGLPPPAPRGHVVTVCFEIDADGILCVSNNEGKTARQKKKIVMDKRSRLSDQEITRLIQEGRVDEEEEKKFLEKAMAISDLDKYVCIMETTLNDENISANFSSQDKENISSAIDKARELVDGDNDNDNEQQDTEAVKDYLEEVKSMCESIIKCKIG